MMSSANAHVVDIEASVPRQRAQKSDFAYQESILQDVSRTFALTIPQMPAALVTVIGNAYLLCRIADTIEDEVSLTAQQKRDFSQQFVAVIEAKQSADSFANALYPRLSSAMLDAERDLVKNTARIIRITHGFTVEQQISLLRCVETMSKGMSLFQLHQYPHGVDKLQRMDQYCFYVAGVVGLMLTELCCQYSKAIEQHREKLMTYALSFGQGLQMTNIIKDVWDDASRGVCWFPQDIFQQHGYDLTNLSVEPQDDSFHQAVEHLIAISHAHLCKALEYILLIPRKERGIRKFCAWALGMAMLTLDKVNSSSAYQMGQSVKISRRSVKWVVLLTSVMVSSNTLLRGLFWLLSRRLPKPVWDDRYAEDSPKWQKIDWP